MKKRKADFFRFETVNIPVSGTFTVDRKTGEIINKQLEYADVPVEALTDLLFNRFGLFSCRAIELPEDAYFAVGVSEKEADGHFGVHKMLSKRFPHESLAYEYMRACIAAAEITGSHDQYSIFMIRPGHEDFPEDIFYERCKEIKE